MSAPDWLAEMELKVGDQVDPATVLGAPEFADGEVIGFGPRGYSVRARRLTDGRLVALKVGRPLPSDRARRRFTEDAAVLQRLPALAHVAPVVAAGVTSGGLSGRVTSGGLSGHGSSWLAAPWYEGGSVADRLAYGALTVSDVVDIARQASAGLAGLHRAGVLHANLTPASLLRDAHGDTALDGMALPSLGPDRAAAGSGPAPAHVPPEVLEGGPWTVAGDIWSLGSCLHTALTGKPPWSRPAQQGTVALILAAATGEPAGLPRPDAPAWLTALVAACLCGNPAERPTSAEAILARIESEEPSLAVTLLPPATGDVEERPLGSSYLLVEPIGSGASGQVWRGRRRWDGKPVAVKVLRPELSSDPEAVARFLRERTTLVGLEHPNLVSILDLVAEGETLAIVMNLIEGPDLRCLLETDGPQVPADACHLLAQVAAGIAQVHRAGIVHRDLKPENVLVEGPGTPTACAKVTDFGIARAVAGPMVTRTDQLLGTAGYMAPELVAGRPLTPAVDVYSLGVLGYELLAGRRPFEAEHPAAILRAHLELEPARPDGLPDAVWDLIAQCLAKDPGSRPDATQASVALEALVPALAGRPALAPSAAPDPPLPLPAGPLSAGPIPAGPPLAGPPYRDETPTVVSPIGLEPPIETAAAPARRWSTRARVGAVAGVVLIGAGTGAGVALTRHTAAGHETGVDVTTAITATGNGVVKVTWSDEETQPGFQAYFMTEDGRLSQTVPAIGATSLTLDGVQKGVQCFEVRAVFLQRPPAHLPTPPTGKECVTVP
jgi:serine/threonine-protein kinase